MHTCDSEQNKKNDLFLVKKRKRYQAPINCEEIISNCLQWLDGYDSWKEFVEENLFQDYVDENWEVIPFCKGHSWEDGSNEISDYDEFF